MLFLLGLAAHQQPLENKDNRTSAHRIIREKFNGLFETSTRQLAGEEGSRIVIQYARGGSGRQQRNQKPQNGNAKKPGAPFLEQRIRITYG